MPQLSNPTEAALPPHPQAPTQQDCCRGDCSPNCVFDLYERELERWQALCLALATPAVPAIDS